PEEVESPKSTVILGESDWDSINIHNSIVAFILEHGYGFGIEYVFNSEQAMATALINGDIDVVVEGRIEGISEYEPAIADGTIVDVSPANDILVNGDFAQRERVAVIFLRRYKISADMTDDLLAYLKENELEARDVYVYFLQEYESLWTQWVTVAVATKVRLALE
ncbi:MAG: glycine betaine ABC transporter substrate-binding protein, partial [Dehalococcoidales bacterium]